MCILDACFRLPDCTFWLSDLGVLPRSLYFRMYEDSLAWSLYAISGRPEYVLSLLLLTIVLGLLQLLKRAPNARWPRVCLWLLVLSVQNRNPALLDSSDALLLLMLFWDMFLPDDPPAERDIVSLATVGLQIQLTLSFLLLSWYTTQESWAQGAAWSLRSVAFLIPWLWIPVKAILLLLVVAVWLRPVRNPAIACTLPVLVLWGVLLHPALPLTIGVSALCLFRPYGRELQILTLPPDRIPTLGALAVSVLIFGQFVPGVRIPAAFFAPALGLEQDWSRSYPLSVENVVEFVARDSQTGQTLWFLDSGSGRRARLWADRAATEEAWTSRLEDALREQVEVTNGPAVWMKKTGLKSNQALGLQEVRLLTETPVRGTVWGRSVP